MKVFFLLTDHLAEDIEEARKEIVPMREGETEICVIAADESEDCVLKIAAEYPCVSRMYVVNEGRVYACDSEHDPIFSWKVPATILEVGDWIFARHAGREGLELIASILGDTKECDLRITV